MATMLLAAAGSVGGTVAWFSAETLFDTTVSTFKVVRLDGDLSCDLTPGVGTAVGAQNNTVKVAENAELTHGSFDQATGTVYNLAGSGFVSKGTVQAAGGSVSGGDLIAGTYTTGTAPSTVTHTVYNAVTWKMTFKYKLPVSASSSGTTNLYFDLGRSSVTPSQYDTKTGELPDTYTGFRIAFFRNESELTDQNVSRTRIWAKHQTSANCKHVNGTASSAITDYTASADLIDSTVTESIAGSASGSADKIYCLGQFKGFNNESVSTIGFTCVAWFEGTDPGIVNAAKMYTVSTALAFYTLPNA